MRLIKEFLSEITQIFIVYGVLSLLFFPAVLIASKHNMKMTYPPVLLLLLLFIVWLIWLLGFNGREKLEQFIDRIYGIQHSNDN